MDACVDDEPHSTKQFGGETPVVGNGILVEAHLLAELLRIERPAFGVRVEAETMQAEFRQPGELLLDESCM